MFHSNTELIKNESSLFEEPKIQTISKIDFVNNVKTAIEKGGEISWLSTDSRSFEWAEINANPKKFLKDLERTLVCKMVDIGMFYPKTKETIYNSYKIKQVN